MAVGEVLRDSDKCAHDSVIEDEAHKWLAVVVSKARDLHRQGWSGQSWNAAMFADECPRMPLTIKTAESSFSVQSCSSNAGMFKLCNVYMSLTSTIQ